MIFKEKTEFSVLTLPIEQMKEHLHLGSGFSDDGVQDGLIIIYMKAAIAAIEGRTGKAILSRLFSLSCMQTSDDGKGLAFPVSPVSRVESVSIIDDHGQLTSLDVNRFYLDADLSRPRMLTKDGYWPNIPQYGKMEIVFEAGFGKSWDHVPSDLAYAIILLSADYYERRHEPSVNKLALPASVQSLTERWRTVRIIGSASGYGRPI